MVSAVQSARAPTKVPVLRKLVARADTRAVSTRQQVPTDEYCISAAQHSGRNDGTRGFDFPLRCKIEDEDAEYHNRHNEAHEESPTPEQHSIAYLQNVEHQFSA